MGTKRIYHVIISSQASEKLIKIGVSPEIIFIEMANSPLEPIFVLDGYLRDHEPHLTARYRNFQGWIKKIDETEGGLEKFSRGYEKMGFNVDEKTGDLVYREWAPGVEKASLVGDFSE
jgi:hypothetical protein